ncbi:SOSS complex subunit C-like isoform X1 [Haliotis rufescens]|uniref:SOSS complex subunit C-like isoform X1 n=1 Tax=Haliotis rufescens TaxID=6454 RepID=UPI001EB02D2B|nr:SOSS complex subunit C-like isoform X1 [Haliotis rufescens]
MAFQAPHTGQELASQKQNRKILEQLEEQKKRLRMAAQGGGVAGAAGAVIGNSANLNPAPPPSALPGVVAGGPTVQQPQLTNLHMGVDQQHMTPQQRAALQHAHANSVGYFITQDSSFGNLILPVLPRFETKS